MASGGSGSSPGLTLHLAPTAVPVRGLWMAASPTLGAVRQANEQRQAPCRTKLAQLGRVEDARLLGQVGNLAETEFRDQRLCCWQFLKPSRMIQMGREVFARGAGGSLLDRAAAGSIGMRASTGAFASSATLSAYDGPKMS